jgi:hypothetical protein
MPCAATIRSSPLGAVWLAVALLLLAAAPSLADDRAPSTGGWFEVDFGAGQLQRSMPGFSDSAPRFFFNVAGGVATPRLLMLGVEVGGWEIRTTSPGDPSRGATVHPLFLTVRIYPLSGLPFNVRLGAGFIIAEGYAQYTSADFTGLGWEAGVGYDVRIRGHHHITPFILYHGGQVSATAVNVRAVTVGAGYTWK